MSEINWQEQLEKLEDEVLPWRSVISAFNTQKKARLIHSTDVIKGVTLENAADVIIEMRVNQQVCKHKKTEVIGHVPMGSFTARRQHCTSCGKVWLDD